MAIQISNNTLLKIIFRQGSDAERESVILNPGEPGFTTDTKRLFVGDGDTAGGILVGNKFLGSGTDITTFAPGEIGDYSYNTDTNILYRLKINDGGDVNDWEAVGGRGINSDTTISNFGTKIENLVKTTTTQWASLSDTRDPNSYYIVSDDNYITF